MLRHPRPVSLGPLTASEIVETHLPESEVPQPFVVAWKRLAPAIADTQIASAAEPAELAAHAERSTQTNAVLIAAVNDWIAATNARDLPRQASFYPSTMEEFYLWRNVSRSAVLAEKRRVFGQARLVDISIAPPEITLEDGGRAATMLFKKKYIIEGARVNRRGEVMQRLRWARGENGWRIVGERDVRVIS
jgi:hypothetical protein